MAFWITYFVTPFQTLLNGLIHILNHMPQNAIWITCFVMPFQTLLNGLIRILNHMSQNGILNHMLRNGVKHQEQRFDLGFNMVVRLFHEFEDLYQSCTWWIRNEGEDSDILYVKASGIKPPDEVDPSAPDMKHTYHTSERSEDESDPRTTNCIEQAVRLFHWRWTILYKFTHARLLPVYLLFSLAYRCPKLAFIRPVRSFSTS
jgi:hypothetical protein